MAGSLVLSSSIIESMIEHARREAPRECVGLLGGHNRRVTSTYPLENESAQPEIEFFVGVGLFAPQKMMRERRQDLVGIYHSHPSGTAYPSKKDLERNYYQGVVHVIISLAEGEPVVRAFELGDGKVEDVVLSLES